MNQATTSRIQYKKDDKKRKHQEKKPRDQAGTIYNLLYVLLVLLFTIPTVIDLISGSAHLGAAFLKFTTVFVILSRPFSMLLQQGAAPETFLNEVFIEGYPVNGSDVNSLFNSYIPLPDIIFVIPFIFLIFALIYLGYKTPPGKNHVAETMKFILSNYLGGPAFYCVIWGIIGMINFGWTIGTILTMIFTVWVTGWLDLLLWIMLGIFLSSIGRFAAGRRTGEDEDSAAYLISSLQKPTPGIYEPPRIERHAAAVEQPVARTVLPVSEPAEPEIKQKYPQRIYCEFCGARIKEGAKFCFGCGVSLKPTTIVEDSVVPTRKVPKEPEQKYVELPIERSRIEEHKKEPVKKEKKPELSPKDVEELERALHKIDGFSATWAIVFMAITAVIGGVNFFFGNWYLFAASMLALPFGFFALEKDRQVFSRWIFERNYSSRGVDLILYGIMGCLCGGAGLMIFVKGILMLLITQNTPKDYPKLNNQQWRARVFQASNTVASKWLLLSIIAGLAGIGHLTPLGVTWAMISTVLGIAIYFIYVRILKPEIMQGNVFDLEIPLIIMGIAAIILNGGGILILIQGILIALQKEEREEPKNLMQDEAKNTVKVEDTEETEEDSS